MVDHFAASVYDLDFKNGLYKGDTLANLLAEAANYVGGVYEIEGTGAIVSLGGNSPQITANG